MKILQLSVSLDNLDFYAYHGVLEQERTVGGEFSVSIRLKVASAERAVFDDELAGTVDYGAVYELLRREMEQPSALLEHVAGRMLSAVFTRFPAVEEAEVSIRKKNPPIGASGEGACISLRAVR